MMEIIKKKGKGGKMSTAFIFFLVKVVFAVICWCNR